jgi:predicted  nucleic acid-binding Zn-ribbon protein
MQTRHRVPTVFTLYMVDVFCCALGCVILLWLVNAREARRQTAANGRTAKQLADVRVRLASTEGEAAALRAAKRGVEQDRDRLGARLQATRRERDDLAKRAAAAEKQHADTRRALEKARGEVAQLQADLKALRAQDAELSAALLKKTKELRELTARSNASEQAVAALQKDVQDKSRQLMALTGRVNGLGGRLKDAEARVRDLGRQADAERAAAAGLRAQLAALDSRSGVLEKDLGRRNQDLDEAAKRLRELEDARAALERRAAAGGKDLAEAQRKVAALEAHAKALTAQVQSARADAERRFAGVSLTGERVVFLVDMSGSMRMRDAYTEDRDKWPRVCEVLGKIVESLPGLKQYQVILFSDRVRYPMGREGYWLDYRPGVSVKEIAARLTKEVPQGETNMYAAFLEAFRYRPVGMDTIYLLSDGLPNVGEGLPPRATGLTETDKAAHLSRYVRQTLKSWWNRDLSARPRVRINTVGFYFDSPDVGAFLWALARENDGSFVGMSKP